MTALLEELVRENVRTLGATISRRRSAEADVRDAENAVRSGLRCYEDVRVAWDRACDTLAAGQDETTACAGLRSAVALLDEWLEGASGVGTFAEAVAARTGRPLTLWSAFQEAIERVRAVRQTATESLEAVRTPLPEVTRESLVEAQSLYEQGKYKNLEDVLAQRLARKP